ncbi:MAG: hypothetical protein ACW99A_19640 [Candidatus Kariarchaeaceae archaeon]|jgi:hypothetical protein
MVSVSFTNAKSASIYGAGIWVISFFYVFIIGDLLGVDWSDEDNKFGPDHEKYWEVEAVIIPSFIILGFLFLRHLYAKSGMSSDNWKEESLGIGLIIMIIQFLLDLIFIVLLFGGGFEYYVALVTLSYFLMPLWAYLFGWYLYGRQLSE